MWPIIFKEESNRICSLLNEEVLAIHHIGSTAVPGLKAKPIIDIVVAVKNRSEAMPYFETLGYKFKGEYNIPLRDYYNKEGFHLHVYEKDHPEINLNLYFRDYLREHPDERDRYAHLKDELVKDTTSFQKINSSFTGYTLGKYDFIMECLTKAGFKQLRVVYCTHYREWDYAAKLNRHKNPDYKHYILYEGAKIVGYAETKEKEILFLFSEKPTEFQTSLERII